jgi:uncharacterized protein (UPF0333 family)
VVIEKKYLGLLVALILLIIGIVISYALGYDWAKVFAKQLIPQIKVISK